MIKLDRKTSKKVCTLLLTSVLTFPLAGQPSYALGYPEQNKMQEASERYSYSFDFGDVYIKDNDSGFKIVLTKEVKEKIRNGEEDIYISFGGNEIKLEDEVVRKIRENLNQRNQINDILGTVIIACTVVYSIASIIVPILSYKDLSKMICNEFDNLLEENEYNKKNDTGVYKIKKK